MSRTSQKTMSKESIYDVLKDEHREVQGLFKSMIDDEKFDRKTFQQIEDLLKVHMAGEEKLFYPRLVSAEQTKEKALEAIEEHNAAKQFQRTVMAADSEVQFAKVQVLHEMISHHIEEEEGQVFKDAKKVLSKDEEYEIANQYLKRKGSG